MSARRALVQCVVLSVQDACVFYPCCSGCFSRVVVEPQDTTRCRCSKCGSSCSREQVEYRYRLSLKVSRDRCIFGVTVFGSCLDPFFGIHASGLQRLVEEEADGTSSRSTLLAKAVNDCFIGRQFIFGIKVTETETGPLFGRPAEIGSSRGEALHFIASQMILPKALGLGGCTVLSYYQLLLQKAAEYELGSTDPSKTPRPPLTSLLLIPQHIPSSSFNNGAISLSGLLSQSPRSSQNQDSVLTPTPPWQQSLGLITSSAEQEEGGSSQDSRQTDTPRRSQRGCRKNHEVSEERAPSPLPSLACSPFRSPSFAQCSHTSVEEPVGNSLKTCISPATPGPNSSKRFSTKSFTSDSLAWEDLPFSESLSEFLCEENKDIVGETELQLNMQNQKGTVTNKLEISSEDKNLSHRSTSVCENNSQIRANHSQTLLDLSNAPNGDDVSDMGYKSAVRYANSCQDRNICSFKQEDQKANSLSFESEEEKQLEVDAYNCSADLFTSSPLIDTDSNKLNSPAETVRTSTEACPLFSESKDQHLMRETAAHSAQDKQKPRNKKCTNRDSLIPADFDFIPPSQSTPIVRTAASSLTFTEFTSQSVRNLPEFNSNKTRTSSSLCQSNCVMANRSEKENLACGTTSSRHSPRFTPKRRFWKPNKRKILPIAQRSAPNTGSTRRISHKCDSSDCDATVCGCEDKEAVVPPTPAAGTRLSVKLRRRRQRCSLDGRQGGEVHCKRTLVDQTVTSSQTGNSESQTAGEDEPCDLSRDLFSDSIF